MKTKIIINVGRIEYEEADAVVNAANASLMGGGGVDGAIHRAAGEGLLRECMAIGECHPGDAVHTRAYRLPAKFVIHTVGPVWTNTPRDAEVLASCYRRSLELAQLLQCKTVAFPAISTGVYGYPMVAATEVAVLTVLDFLRRDDCFDGVRFVCFTEQAAQIYRLELAEHKIDFLEAA